MTDSLPNSPIDEPTRAYPNSRVSLVLDQYLEDLQNGRACGRDELLENHPDIQNELLEYLDGIEMIAGLGVGSELVPQQLGDFEIVKPIGRGAMGVVYLANQVSLKRQIALKVLRYSVSGQQATKRFEREAELVATLRHENIVPVYATGVQDNSNFLAMQLIDGPSLAQWSADEEVVRDPKTIAKWGAQVARALSHAHQRDVIHRDVKPSNLLKDQDHIWLTDFGLARRYDDLRMSMTGAMLGTPNYMSPEQAAPTRHPIDFRTDIYSLGATLFELLTGRCVFLAESPHAVLSQVIAEEPPPLRQIVPHASRDLETILLKCLEKEPHARYQTAEQLADDLDAFVQDRSIKARRPSLIERATRWQRENQKVTSAVTAAIAAAVLLLAVSLAAWTTWKDSITGTVEITANDGPFVGRLIDDAGTKSPTFAIPTLEPLPFTGGDYTLQMWSGGRMGENQRISIDAKGASKIAAEIPDQGVFKERTVRGIPKKLHLGDVEYVDRDVTLSNGWKSDITFRMHNDRDDLLFFHNRGITRMDGRKGQELWTANVPKIVETINETNREQMLAASKEDEKADDMLGAADKNPLDIKTTPARVRWRRNFDSISHYDRDGQLAEMSMPMVVQGFPDINSDAEQDVLIASRRQAVLFAFDGRKGELLWHYNAGLRDELPDTRTIRQPISLGDIDADGIPDFGCIFSGQKDRREKVLRWMDAVSGKTGERIWRRRLPAELFKTAAKAKYPSFCQIDASSYFFPSKVQARENQWAYRSHRLTERQKGDLVPWAAVRVSDSSSKSGWQILLACGPRIVSCDPQTGKPGSFNNGKPLDVGFVPALQPQLVKTLGDDGETLGLLLTEILKFAGGKNSAKPITRFSMWSVESGKEIWRYDAICEPQWLDSPPDWPIVADLNGDSVPEIVVVDQAELDGNSRGPQSSVQALDGRTGKPIWQPNETPKIRSLNAQIQHLLIGPDQNGDQQDDIYVVTPMFKSQSWIFVDILSGTSGKRIRTLSNKVPVFNFHGGLFLERPFFLGNRSDEHQLVIATQTPSELRNYKRHSTVIMSMATGELTHIGEQLEHPILADGDGDGSPDLFMLKPRDRSKLVESSQLVSLKSISGGLKLSGDTKFAITEDVDGDGVRDLIKGTLNLWQSYRGGNHVSDLVPRMISGASGKPLFDWKSQYQDEDTILTINGDLNNDGVDDHLAIQPPESGNYEEEVTTLKAVSGADGTAIWQQETNTGFRCCPVVKYQNGDGQPKLLILFKFGNNKNIASRYRMLYVDGRSGNKLWHSDLTTPGTYSRSSELEALNSNLRFMDVDADGTQDIICPNYVSESSKVERVSFAVNGKSGEPIWQIQHQSEGMGPWKSHRGYGIIPAAGAKAACLAAVQEGRVKVQDAEGSKSKQMVTVNFFDATNGKKVSTWTAEGRFPHPQDDYLCHAGGTPFAIANGDQRLAGIFLEGDKDSELVVIDFSTQEATEVRRMSPGVSILLDDVNNDGRTDGVFYNKNNLVSIELASGKEIHRERFYGVGNNRHLIKYWPNEKLISAQTAFPNGRRIKLIDPTSLKVTWAIDWPEGFDFNGLLCPGDFTKQGLAPYPLASFSNRSRMITMIKKASPAEYRGDPELLKSNAQLRSKTANAETSSVADPRLAQPLPWNIQGSQLNLMEVNGLDHSPSVWLTQIFPIVLGAIIFPVWFLFVRIRDRRWSLRSFLLLPVILILPFMLLQIPSQLGAEYASSNEVTYLQGKFIAAIKIVPFLIFIGAFLSHCWNWNWKTVLGLMAFTLLVSALLVWILLMTSIITKESLVAGGYYQWLDPRSLSLVWAGVWTVGIGIVIKRLAVWLWAFASNFLRKRFPSRELAAS